MVRKILNIVLFSAFSGIVFSQTGGDNVYEFLNLTHSGLVSSLGGSNVSLKGNNINLSYHNPSLLDRPMAKSLSLNFVNYYAGINYGLAIYSPPAHEKFNFAAGITYLNYGSFTEADASGNITGDFRASEYAFSLIFSHKIDTQFSVGINIKPVLSHLEKYTSAGLAVDLGASWHSLNELISAGFVIKNAGYQVTTYAGEKRLPPPFEIQAGASAKLAHAPLRFSLTVRHLEKFDLTNDYPGSVAGDENSGSSPEFLENLLRHLVIGTELLPHKNFYISGGFNYQVRKELQSEANRAGTGFSWGFGFNTSVIGFEFGRSSLHLAGSSTHISLNVYPDLLFKRLNRKD